MNREGYPIEAASWSRSGEEFDDVDEAFEWRLPEDDVTLQPISVELKSTSLHFPIKTNGLIVALQGAPVVFLSSFINLEQFDQIAAIKLPEATADLKRRFGAKSTNRVDDVCFVYKSKIDNTAIAIVNYLIPEERAVGWLNKLFALVEPQSVVVLDTITRADYTSENPNQSIPLLLRLATKAFEDLTLPNLQSSYLAPPNWVTGATASLLTKCEIHNIKSVALLSLRENSRWVELESVQAFENEVKYLCQSTDLISSQAISVDLLKNYQTALSQTNKNCGEALYI